MWKLVGWGLLLGSQLVVTLAGQTVRKAAGDRKPGFGIAKSQPSQPAGQPQTTSPAESPRLPPGQTRRYFIAAEEVDWDYTPGGRNLAGLHFGTTLFYSC